VIKNYYLKFIILLLSFFSCERELSKKKYLALGDNYTIGENISENNRWPIQLAEVLNKNNISIGKPKIIAKTGWTTDELKSGIDVTILDYPYDFVSLLIGVNNQFKQKSLLEFKEEFQNLLNQAVSFSGNKKEHVFVVSIPDWGVMPFAEGRDREQVRTEIDNFNQIIYEICAIERIAFIDITSISRDISKHPEWIASDGFHPSGAQYTEWVNEILPFFLNIENE